MKRLGRAVLAGMALVMLLPALALAHPLGNFTINHFAAIRVGADRVALDVVIDHAEIPAFQARQALDTDGDGAISALEQEAARTAMCSDLTDDLSLAAAGTRLTLRPIAAGLSFPAGAGGLPTMRAVCEYEAALPAAAGGPIALTFADKSFAERIGWREIVTDGDLAGVSRRLTSYPEGLLARPLDVRAVELLVTPAVVTTTPWSAPDAQPLDGAVAEPSPVAAPPPAGVPGGIGAELAAIVDARDLTPSIVLGSMLIAIVLGAAHAASPGHGKTIMAAYLVGTRGTARQAVALGLTVTVSHTLGVMVLAGVTLLAAAAIPPERLYPVLGVGSGVLVVAIGATLLYGRLRVLLATRRHARAHRHDHDHDHVHDHGHSHAPAAASLSWRGMFALGLSGGLMPSATALILLLGAISAGRVGYGVLLVLGFGIGMAIVLGGVGFALVHAARLLERLPTGRLVGRWSSVLQAATAALVVVLGISLTGQALTQVF